MVGSISTERASRALEFGMYRDGDNNLDDIQAATIAQAVQTSRRDASIEFTVEDTTARRGFEPAHVLRTESYTIAGGAISKHVAIDEPRDMSSRSELAKFVDHVLDDAENSNAKQRGSISSITAAATAAVCSRATVPKESCAKMILRARSPTASHCMQRNIPKTRTAKSTAWLPINA